MDSGMFQRRNSTHSDTSVLICTVMKSSFQPPRCTSREVNGCCIPPTANSSLSKMGCENTQMSPSGTPRQDCSIFQGNQGSNQSETSEYSNNPGIYPNRHSNHIFSPSKESKHSENQNNFPSIPENISSERTSPLAHSNLDPRHSLPLIKEPTHAILPSVAECLRAVFAAFLWHEGVVHDAMACASFLKFHPTLPRNRDILEDHKLVQKSSRSDIELTKAQKARQRHSVEVSNAGNFLHIQTSTLETLTRSAANANADRNRRRITTNSEQEIHDEVTYPPQSYVVQNLPPALESLVLLWDELSTHCLHTIDGHSFPSSLTSQDRKIPKKLLQKAKGEKCSSKERKSHKKKKEWEKFSNDYMMSGGSEEYETTCELCEFKFPHPVTVHMKTMHPGCGWHSGGMGYNNVGNYCSGWAGNCGDSDFGGTCWYLICNSCRNNYLKTRWDRVGGEFPGNPSRRSGKHTISPFSNPVSNEKHIMMKNNAIFLLKLSSAAGITIPKQGRRSSMTLTSGQENNSFSEVSPFPTVDKFRCLSAFGVPSTIVDGENYYEVTPRNRIDEKSRDRVLHTGSKLPNDPLVNGSSTKDSKIRGAFHRSISMSTGATWAQKSNNESIVMMRERNDSSCDSTNKVESSLLCHPSSHLQKLVPTMTQSGEVSSRCRIPNTDRVEIPTRPVILFVLQQHNLQQLQMIMEQALRRAACRVYAMQAFNWLLKSVTQPICLHDLLWWFHASLTPTQDVQDSDRDLKIDEKEELDLTGVCEHPLSDLVITSEAANPLSSVFHGLLQTIADSMLLPPPGSPLQRASVRCWGIKFMPNDHPFLHRSHVFSNISKILSRSEEDDDIALSIYEPHRLNCGRTTPTVEALKDITSGFEIKASSRQAMIGHLTDSSTETFWESGDEDRNKIKIISITFSVYCIPKVIYIHIDNGRDSTHKISCVIFRSGMNPDGMLRLRSVEVEGQFVGWVKCLITDSRPKVINLEFKGPDNSLRVRQIRILGIIGNESIKIEKQLGASTIQQRNCEAETLRVFRLITSQVFGNVIQNKHQPQLDSGVSNDDLQESNDLREHMVGILFSQSKLTHLQKQVCTHIVQAIRKETIRHRDEWENFLSSSPTKNEYSDSCKPFEASDIYCFEMLSMVSALSGSSVGQIYLSVQFDLLEDLLSLLHTGSARVQRQVISLLRRILPEIAPSSLANVLDIVKLPPSDFSIVSITTSEFTAPRYFDMYSPGILDIFLSCIAKALDVRVKVIGKENGKTLQTASLAMSIHPKSFYGTRWWLRGCMTQKLAAVIIELLKDMACGKLNETWALVTKAAIAENILNLTRLEDKFRNPSECLKTPTLWLALSSLCVLDPDHVQRLSSGQWGNTIGQSLPLRPKCSNHDDGETSAIIQCNTCGNLCSDCDRVLHLHRRARLHLRQVCKEEEEAIRVDLHEGCGRTKLFWLFALADSQTLKALIEFRDGAPKKIAGTASGICRFCGAISNSGLLAISNICSDHECQEHAKNACSKTHKCGHICGGIRNEEHCLPCLHHCRTSEKLKQDSDDMCMICFTDALSCAPAIQLTCGHVFHLHCCENVLMKKWVGPRITFGYSLCPICKTWMQHTSLVQLLAGIEELYTDVRRKALMRLEYEGLHKILICEKKGTDFVILRNDFPLWILLSRSEAVVALGGRYYQNPSAYAMDRYAYYVCFKCQRAYYGGEARCDVLLGGEHFDPTELVCGACSDVARAQMCPKHGADFLEYKCRYCCSTAVFFCFGTTHFCNSCHDDFQRVTNIPKNELPACPAGPKGKQMEGDECPLHVRHPPTGEEFALGCGICRNAHTF